MAVLKDIGRVHEVREEWIRVGRNGWMSLKGAGGVVVRRNYSVDLFGGERDEVGVNRGGDGRSK